MKKSETSSQSASGKKVVIVGGGASGMLAAIMAARNGAKVVILEHKDRIGKKILSTGNGRCNFTNTLQTPECYRSTDSAFPWKVLSQFPALDTIAFFQKLGIYSKNRNGYLYPYSDQASAVLDALRLELESLKVEIQTETEVMEIRPVKHGFTIRTSKGKVSADRVILSTGSKAAPKTGSDGSGYGLAKSLGHHLTPVVPALVQLRCKESFYKSISGVRLQGTVTLLNGSKEVASDTGEIQITDYGVSGIPVFQISRYAALGLYYKEPVSVRINFMPDFSAEQFQAFLENRIQMHPNCSMEHFFIGLFHKKMSAFFLRLANISPAKQAGALTKTERAKLLNTIQHFETVVEATNSYEKAQICAGGLSTDEIDPDTLESRLIDGLYFAGELLDVDGICGGYNLQWAWSSGYVAGKHAAIS